MHSLIERATWDNSMGSSHLASLNGTKTEMEAIFGTMTKIDMGINNQTNVHVWEYQSEVMFKSDKCYFSVFTEMVPEDELDDQIHWKVDMYPQHFKDGLFTRIEALIT